MRSASVIWDSGSPKLILTRVTVIPSKAQMVYGIRSQSAFKLADLIPEVLRCFEGAATATGCKLDLEHDHLYLEVVQSDPLARTFAEAAKRCWDSKDESYEIDPHMVTGASTDFGNVSYACPALHPMFNLPEAGPDDHPRKFE